jgi:hypothetical protein
MLAKSAAAASSCLITMATSAQASSCMSKAEARAAYPSAHLYWYGEGHCWGSSPTVTRAQYIRHRETSAKRPPSPAPSNEIEKISTPAFPAVSGNFRQASDLRQWAGTMAMLETPEIAPWINRWPELAIKPPSRPVFTEAAADSSLVTARGIVAMIMTLSLSVALFEVLFGGSNVRRLTFRPAARSGLELEGEGGTVATRLSRRHKPTARR